MEFTRSTLFLLLNSPKPLWLVGADLSEADLRGANLREADLREADLSGADLTTTRNLWKGQLYEAFWDVETKLPPRILAEPCPVGGEF